MSFDAVIIGGGIVGAACAFRLSEEGLKVAIVEENFVGSGTTAAGMGHIVVMDDSEEQFALSKLSQDLWNELAFELPDSNEFEKCGTIWVAANEEELSEAEKKQAFYHDRKIRARVLDGKDLAKLEPNLRWGLRGGLLVERDSVVYQLAAAKYFSERAIDNGAELICQKAVRIDLDQVLFESGEKISGSNIINAAGIGAKDLSPELRIESKKGHLAITDRYYGYISHQIIELGYLKSAHHAQDESVAFNVQPRKTGQVLIGSSRQPGDDSTSVDGKILKRMLERAFEYMPDLRKMSAVRVWTGNRPSTPDNLPYIGRSTSNRKVIVAAGHEGLGITTSLGTAELVADIIFERDSGIERDVYAPERIGAVLDD